MRKRIRFARLGTCNTPVQTMHGLIINLRGLECAVISGAWGVFKIGHSHHELEYWLTDRPQHRVCVNVRAIHYHIKEALWSAPPQPLLLSFSAPPQLLSDTAGEYKSFPLRCSLKGLTIQFQTHRTQTMALSKCEKIKSWPFWIRRHNQELTLPKCCRKNFLVFFFPSCDTLFWKLLQTGATGSKGMSAGCIRKAVNLLNHSSHQFFLTENMSLCCWKVSSNEDRVCQRH